jgi:hypothetical protein
VPSVLPQGTQPYFPVPFFFFLLFIVPVAGYSAGNRAILVRVRVSFVFLSLQSTDDRLCWIYLEESRVPPSLIVSSPL